ncbi:mCG144932, partial [Mus musculus]
LIVRPKERPAGCCSRANLAGCYPQENSTPTPSPSKQLSLGKGKQEKGALKQGSHPTNALPVCQVSLQRDQTKALHLGIGANSIDNALLRPSVPL